MYDLRVHARGAGCGLKLGGPSLERMLGDLRAQAPNRKSLLVGLDSKADYGAVSMGAGKQALVQSVDLIAPVCREASTLGHITVCHALSDVYASGATPLCAVAVLVLPEDVAAVEVGSELMGAISARLLEENCLLLGGHTVRTGETLLVGLAATGTVDSDKLIKANGAKPGDALLLTKPIGTGLYIAADRHGHYDLDFNAALDVMQTSNKLIQTLQKDVELHAAVDVAGFGLADALCRIAIQSSLSVTVDFEAVPLLPQAIELAKLGFHTRLTDENFDAVRHLLTVEGLSESELVTLNDPQTSGGLLIALGAEDLELCSQLCCDLKYRPSRIGSCSTGEAPGRVFVRKTTAA